MQPSPHTLFASIKGWVKSENRFKSVVLFGSSASGGHEAAPDPWADYDLHVIATAPDAWEKCDWKRVLPNEQHRLSAARPTTGGVRKTTVIFESGQMDLVLVPLKLARLARLGLCLGWQQHNQRLAEGLNEIHTCVCRGYRFLKGEAQWGAFYQAVARDMSGMRLDDTQIADLARIAAVDHHWIMRKVARGECQAAQHVLHCSLAATNFKLVRELRQRRGQPLPSYGLARHTESILTAKEQAWVSVDARCGGAQLLAAADRCLEGTRALLREMGLVWPLPDCSCLDAGGEAQPQLSLGTESDAR